MPRFGICTLTIKLIYCADGIGIIPNSGFLIIFCCPGMNRNLFRQAMQGILYIDALRGRKIGFKLVNIFAVGIDNHIGRLLTESCGSKFLCGSCEIDVIFLLKGKGAARNGRLEEVLTVATGNCDLFRILCQSTAFRLSLFKFQD